MKYFKNKQNELYVDPIVEKHIGLEELTKEEFDTQLVINNTPTPEQVLQESIAKAQAYLASTDFKMTVDYDQDITEVTTLRAEARTYIRENS